MEIFTIKNAVFYNDFCREVELYAESTYNEITASIVNDSNNFYKHFFDAEEIETLILINKALFQNIRGFFHFVA